MLQKLVREEVCEDAQHSGNDGERNPEDEPNEPAKVLQNAKFPGVLTDRAPVEVHDCDWFPTFLISRVVGSVSTHRAWPYSVHDSTFGNLRFA